MFIDIHGRAYRLLVGLVLEWREKKMINEEVFCKVARENAVKLLGLE